MTAHKESSHYCVVNDESILARSKSICSSSKARLPHLGELKSPSWIHSFTCPRSRMKLVFGSQLIPKGGWYLGDDNGRRKQRIKTISETALLGMALGGNQAREEAQIYIHLGGLCRFNRHQRPFSLFLPRNKLQFRFHHFYFRLCSRLSLCDIRSCH